MTTAPLRHRAAIFLHVQDGLLAEEDEKLPFSRHVVSTLQHFYFVEDFVFLVFMRTEKVIVCDPKSKVVVGTVDVIKAVCVTVRGLIGAVQPFNHLFEWTVFCGNSIVVGKSNNLGDFEGKIFPELFYEFHCGERVGAVTVSNELKVFRQLCKPPESHAHSEDAGTDAAVVGYLITDDGTGSCIHDEPYVRFDAADFDIGFIRSEHAALFVRILIDKGFDADSGSLTVVGDLLVGNADVVQVF